MSRLPGTKSIFRLFVIYAILCTHCIWGRKHHLEVRDDVRPYIALSTFGFYIDGHLDVKLSQFTISAENENDLFGLSLDKTTIDQTNPYLNSHQNKCILEGPSATERTGPIVFFLFDLKKKCVKVQFTPEWKNIHIYKNRSMFPMYRGKRQSIPKVSDSAIFLQRRRRDTAPHDDEHELPQSDDMILPQEDDDSMEDPPEIVNGDTAPKASPTVNVASPVAAAGAVANSISAEPAAKADTDVAANAPAAVDVNSLAIVPEMEPVAEAAAVAGDVPDADAQLPEPPAPIVAVVPAPAAIVPAVPTAAILPAVKSKPETVKPQNKYNAKDFILPLTKTVVNGVNYYNMSFSMLVASLHDEGLYNLYFHACPNYEIPKAVSFDVDIEENNNGNYLSAGEMPLPALYFMMSLLFFLSGLFWVFILKKTKHSVYKIHYIMAVLVFLKSLSLMFHSINYHFIETRGEHVEAWAILYYVTHLLKGAVLFITIVLIGTGWTFIKHILSDKDKKIFMIVIPLQVLANVAQIIIDESEKSDVEFFTWHKIFNLVDLLCCCAILFPIVWSIRHLNVASGTDGNLRKLKLFHQFYIMIVCYIYFTRIIVYLLNMAVAFQYAWLDEMFHEMATYVFFVLTGYKFRPVSSHPYFSVADEDPDNDEVEVLTESGLTEGLRRTKVRNRNAPPTTVIVGNDEERDNLISKRESSHEYD